MHKELYFNVDIDYLFINIVMLVTFYIAGLNISRKKSYFVNSLFCIVIYTLGLGLRYGRGWDYFHYIEVYEYDIEDSQLLFTWFNQWLKSIGVGRYYFFMIYNFIYICCSMVFLQAFKKYAKYAFPLFMIATLHLTEYSIRQGLAFSFVWLYVYCLFKIGETNKQNKIISLYYVLLCLLLLIISYSIHSICIITIVWYTSFVFIKKPFPLLYTIPIFLVVYFVLQNLFDFSGFNGAINFMAASDEKFAQYAEHSDEWFGEGQVEVTRNILIKPIEALGIISLFYWGYKIITEKLYNYRMFVVLYNVFVAGTISYQLFTSFEIVGRVFSTGSVMWFFPLSLALFYRKKHCNNIERVMLFSLIWWSYEYLKYLFVCGDMCKFLWDAPGEVM